MSVYEYIALDEKGRRKKGMLAADNARKARQDLRAQGLFPISLWSHRFASNDRKNTGGRLRLTDADLSVVTRQFSILLSSGLTIEECFDALVNQDTDHRRRTMLGNIRGKVTEGYTLAYAFSTYPRTFSELYICAVEAGERSGKLSEVMDSLANYVEDRLAVSQRITNALVYPAILVVVSMLIVSGLVSFVIPKVAIVFLDSGQSLPWITQALIAISDFLRHNSLAIAVALTALPLTCRFCFQQQMAKLWLHGIYLKLPGIRGLSQELNAARMAKTLSIMTGSSVPLLSALDAAIKVITNHRMRLGLGQVASDVKEGVSLYRALERTKCFPPLMVQMIQNGERSGRLVEMLEKSATITERQIEPRIATMVSLFEPIMILLMGGLVMLIVLAILLPIFDMNQLISQ